MWSPPSRSFAQAIKAPTYTNSVTLLRTAAYDVKPYLSHEAGETGMADTLLRGVRVCKMQLDREGQPHTRSTAVRVQ